MRAWRADAYGAAAGVTLVEMVTPAPRAGEVLLRVRATSLNAGDVHLLHGEPLLARSMSGMSRPKFPIRGLDAVGEVVDAGQNVLGVEVGDVVVGEMHGGGGLGEYVTVAADRVQPLPPGVAERDVVTLPVAGGTAWQALDRAEVGLRGRAERVLVLGASGGVGTFAVQFAAMRGAEVWATCADGNQELVERLGAAHTLDHRREPLSAIPTAHFDAVIDIAGDVDLRDLRRLVSPDGAIVLVAANGGHVLGSIPRAISGGLRSVGSGPGIHALAATHRPEVLTKMLELLAAERFAPVISHEYSFDEADAALARIEAGHVVGKLVVRVG